MKYIRTLNYIICTIALFVLLFAALRVIGLLCTATMPLLDALFAWLAARALPIAVTVVIGFTLWIFADVCDAQARKERGK